MKYTNDNITFDISRYPHTNDKSLKAWNAGDELLLSECKNLLSLKSKIAIYNDSFGFINTFLSAVTPTSIIDNKSQEKSILLNLKNNNVEPLVKFLTPLDDLSNSKFDIALIKTPKSLDHFSLYLSQISNSLASGGVVICSFMTRHFTPQLIKIAASYFEDVTQSRAVKKARTLTLKNPKKTVTPDLTITIPFDDNLKLQQYLGVFSAKRIDIASQFLIDNMIIDMPISRVLDLGSGNGILAKIIEQKNDCEIHLIDDAWLAIASSKLNFDNPNIHFHWQDELSSFEDNYFDFIISNPPFHFGHENNIDITINLFKGIKRILSKNGEFQMVANKHLNYITHLDRVFSLVEIIAENDKFIIYSCRV